MTDHPSAHDDPSAQALFGRSADERLLDGGAESLPSSIGRPVALPARQGGSPLVGLGVALGAITLIGGIALALIGVIRLLSSSAFTHIAELAAGILLVGTHWGWIHVGAWTNDKLEGRRDHHLLVDRRRWLAAVEPFARYEVTTHVGDDGSITIETVCHRPVATGSDRFTFAPEQIAVEVHSPDEAAAAIAERAELMRRQAAARTADAREQYQALAEAHETAHLRGQDEQEQNAVRRAVSQALSEQLNSKLRDPPLVE